MSLVYIVERGERHDKCRDGKTHYQCGGQSSGAVGRTMGDLSKDSSADRGREKMIK